MNQEQLLESQAILKYKEFALDMLQYSFKHLDLDELSRAVDYSILKRCKNNKATIENNYKNITIDSSVLEVADYVLTREPIITAYGVMFKKHAEEINPIAILLQKFLKSRVANKKEMFKYPKGSEMFEKYNLFQLLDKIDANGVYGILGQCTCLLYNINIAASITSQGQSLISSAGLQFEMFLANNCKFGSLNEVIDFIHNILSERKTRKYKDSVILDKDISVYDCVFKVLYTCGFNYVPSEKDTKIVWDIISQLDQEDINRIYYKNNLYEFMETQTMNNAFVYLIEHLESPYLDPNELPEEISVELDEFCSLLMEYVYYSHQVIDKVDKYNNLYRSVCIITDTDSTIISLDPWYRYASAKVNHLDLKIKHDSTDIFKKINKDEFGDYDLSPIFTKVDVADDYSFYDDAVIEREKLINPFIVSPQEGLRYSIINIMAYCLGNIINDYMIKFTQNSNSYSEDRKCLIIMKNEFLFKRVLLVSSAKKNYASIQEIQEGKVVPKNKQLDIKGLMMGKSNLTKSTQAALQKIMYEDILMNPDVNQVQVLKSLAKFEKEIFNKIQSGSKEFYKPVKIKSIGSYSNPMGQQGVKAAVVYNRLRSTDMEALDLNEQNSLDIIKVVINHTNIEKIKDVHPSIYEGFMELSKDKYFSKGIDAIALPKNEIVPGWLLDYIDYNTIISDNASHMPIESLGVYRGRGSNSYTNILSI